MIKYKRYNIFDYESFFISEIVRYIEIFDAFLNVLSSIEEIVEIISFLVLFNFLRLFYHLLRLLAWIIRAIKAEGVATLPNTYKMTLLNYVGTVSTK